MKKNIFLVFPFFLCTCLALESTEFMYTREPACQVQEKIAGGCAMLDSTVRGLVDCLTLCNSKDTCTGASVTQSLKCYLFNTCSNTHSCDAGDVSYDHEYFAKLVCENNGVWEKESNMCKCKDGWVGLRCHELPKSCNDLISHDYSSAWYRVTLDLSHKGLPNVEVQCYIKTTAPTYSIVALMKNSGHSDHAKSWVEYCDGFEEGASQMWLGLENWYILSEAGYNTLTIKANFHIPALLQTSWQYSNFRLSGSNAKYAFTFDFSENSTNGDSTEYPMEDCLAGLQNVPFSTHDYDTDDDPGNNCAQTIGSGWWYDGCDAPCNLLGWKWGAGYNVPPASLINLKGVDMLAKGGQLVWIEMYLTTPT